MSWLTSAGRFLRRIYLNPQMFLIAFLPCIVYVILVYVFHAGEWAFGVLMGMIFLDAWLCRLYADWREMYRVGMHMADKTTELAGSGLYKEVRYATVKMSRVFPRYFWVMIVVDEDSVRMHQGWSFFGGIPKPERIAKSRIYRQVALDSRS